MNFVTCSLIRIFGGFDEQEQGLKVQVIVCVGAETPRLINNLNCSLRINAMWRISGGYEYCLFLEKVFKDETLFLLVLQR